MLKALWLSLFAANLCEYPAMSTAQPLAIVGDLGPQRRSTASWAFLASVGVHLGMFLVLAVTLAPSLDPVPIGVELQYVDPAASSGPMIKSSPPLVPKPVRRVLPKAEEPGLVSKPNSKRDAETALQDEAPTASSGPAGVRDGAVVGELERYKFELRLFLESRKVYPERAKRLNQTGTVVVQFKVGSQGELLDIVLEQPAGSEALNRAALDLVRQASRFKPLPQSVQVSGLKLSLPIHYRL